jgi:UDP-4-amino-4,6-dideoxy-N-acetyl-beta-L-altrosamine transaminase
MNYIPYGRQQISEEDIAAVDSVLRSDWLTQGPTIERFEEAVARYCGVRFAVAFNSGTAALHLACQAAGLGPGDTLWTSPNTFVASANAARYCGATVDFVDIDRRTYNLSVESLAAKLRAAADRGALPRIVMPVHFAGQSCQMREISRLANEYGFRIIEDASHAVGGRYLNRPVGNCEHSSIAVFSFHPVKIITTGEGGMAVTNDPELARRMRLLRSHGVTRDPNMMHKAPEGPWYYEQLDLGFNYRLTDIQAALGLSQFQRTDEFVRRRHALAARYDHELAGLPLILPWQHPDAYSAYHLYAVQINRSQSGHERARVFERLRADGVGVNVHYIPVHTQPYYAQQGFRSGDYPEAERYYSAAISLPLFPALTEAQQGHVITSLKRALSE